MREDRERAEGGAEGNLAEGDASTSGRVSNRAVERVLECYRRVNGVEGAHVRTAAEAMSDKEQGNFEDGSVESKPE